MAEQPVSCLTCLDHLLDIVSDVLEKAGSHLGWAMNNQAHGKRSPAGQPGHEGAGVRGVCWNSKPCHELKGTLHSSLDPGHVSKEGIAPQRAAEQRVGCHGGNVYFPCRTEAVALSHCCSTRNDVAHQGSRMAVQEGVDFLTATTACVVCSAGCVVGVASTACKGKHNFVVIIQAWQVAVIVNMPGRHRQ